MLSSGGLPWHLNVCVQICLSLKAHSLAYTTANRIHSFVWQLKSFSSRHSQSWTELCNSPQLGGNAVLWRLEIKVWERQVCFLFPSYWVSSGNSGFVMSFNFVHYTVSSSTTTGSWTSWFAMHLVLFAVSGLRGQDVMEVYCMLSVCQFGYFVIGCCQGCCSYLFVLYVLLKNQQLNFFRYS